MPPALTDQFDEVAAVAEAAAQSWLLARIGPERYALHLASVSEILEDPRLAPVPGLPAEVLGMIVSRERRLTVWNAEHHLGHSVARPAGAVLVLESQGSFAAVAVDEASDVTLLDEESVHPLPALDDPLQLVIGVARDDAGLITVLDVNRLVRALAGGDEVVT